ncbi:MAG: FixH family protein [Chitinophagaceae bacterium]|nr:FixH family protein [Chitinophagaceae bacterium]
MNWGNRLLLVFIVFGLGMGYLVYRTSTTDFDMVESDYYATELRYQQEIDASKNAQSLSTPVNLEQNEKGVIVHFPDEMKNKKLEGTILFYCAYDRKSDRQFQIQPDSDGKQLIPATELPSGHFFVKINWKDADTKYYMEKQLSVL